MRKHKRNNIPENFKDVEHAAEFWDTHDLGDYLEYTKPVKAQIKVKELPRYINVEENIAKALQRIAKKHKISVEVLVNLWLQEKIFKVS